MRMEGLRSQTGNRRRPGRYSGKPPVAAPDQLERLHGFNNQLSPVEFEKRQLLSSEAV